MPANRHEGKQSCIKDLEAKLLDIDNSPTDHDRRTFLYELWHRREPHEDKVGKRFSAYHPRNCKAEKTAQYHLANTLERPEARPLGEIHPSTLLQHTVDYEASYLFMLALCSTSNKAEVPRYAFHPE